MARSKATLRRSLKKRLVEETMRCSWRSFPVGGQGHDDVIDLELVGSDAVAPPGYGHGHQHHEDAHGEPRALESADHGHEEPDDASAANGAPPADGRPVGFLLDDFHFDGQDVLDAVFLALGLR